MLASLALIAQVSAAAPAQAASVQASPAQAASAARPVADASTPDPSAPSAEGLEELRRAFHDSCEVRVYGEYDDLCSGLADEIHRYRTALQRAARRPPPR